MKRKYFYTHLNSKGNFGYKANYITFIVVCFLIGIDKRNANNKVKSKFCWYAFNHSKLIRFITNLINNLFIVFMFITKYDLECLNSIEFNNKYMLEKLNTKYYKKDNLKIDNDFIEGIDLKKKSMFLFLIRYYYENKKFLYYSIEDEILDTTFNYYYIENI